MPPQNQLTVEELVRIGINDVEIDRLGKDQYLENIMQTIGEQFPTDIYLD